MKPILLVVYAALLTLPLTAQAQSLSATPTAPHATLSKPCPTTQGDMVALMLTEFMPVARAMNPWSIDAPVVAAYDPAAGKIVVSVYGARSSVDEAKAALEYFNRSVFPVLASAVQRSLRVSIEESDLTVVYFDRTHDLREVIRRQGGQYVVK